MTRVAYDGCHVKDAAVRRILDRYLIEVVERYDLCPWARSARTNGEVAIDIVWGGAPALATWIATAQALLARPTARVAMVVAPELQIDASALHRLRNEVASAIVSAGVAEFHPAAPLDLTNPPRLVPFLRRAPDPLLQLVPFTVLESVRGTSKRPVLDRAEQLKLLEGVELTIAMPPRANVADRIAVTNHETVTAHHAEIARTLEAIAADRAAAYAAAGIAV